MKRKKSSRTQVVPPKQEAFETLALAEQHIYYHPGNIPMPSEENILTAKNWVDEDEK